jgi:cobyrinic acid a,c-diamide synthase
VVSIGISAALSERSLSIQTFKKGPDYIDPIWLSQASNNPCYNLDFFNMSNDDIVSLYSSNAYNSDVNIIEGNKGLYDGVSPFGGDSNADLAKLLNIPVILVIDVTGITRGVAPLLKGYQDFDSGVKIAGVIFNKVAGDRHESKLIQATKYYTDIPILGSIRRSIDLVIEERHLGLMPANETPESKSLIGLSAKRIADQVDLEKIISLNQLPVQSTTPGVININKSLTLAVAKDSAFGFYYQDDIDAFKSLGVDIVYFNTLTDAKVPSADALFIGGGFPETQLESLSLNISLLNDIKAKIEAGLPTYAECGGMMYLSRQITYNGDSHKMVGIIKADTLMTDKPIGRGYVKLKPTKRHLWNDVAKQINAHEFHYSKLENIDPKTDYAYRVLRGVGVDNKRDGIIVHNLMATYSHLRNVGSNKWAEQFVNFIKSKKL